MREGLGRDQHSGLGCFYRLTVRQRLNRRPYGVRKPRSVPAGTPRIGHHGSGTGPLSEVTLRTRTPILAQCSSATARSTLPGGGHPLKKPHIRQADLCLRSSIGQSRRAQLVATLDDALATLDQRRGIVTAVPNHQYCSSSATAATFIAPKRPLQGWRIELRTWQWMASAMLAGTEQNPLTLV